MVRDTEYHFAVVLSTDVCLFIMKQSWNKFGTEQLCALAYSCQTENIKLSTLHLQAFEVHGFQASKAKPPSPGEKKCIL